jgi:hypothetical protein
VLTELAKSAGRSIEMVTPESAFKQMFAEYGSKDPDWAGADEFASYARRQGS